MLDTVEPRFCATSPLPGTDYATMRHNVQHWAAERSLECDEISDTMVRVRTKFGRFIFGLDNNALQVTIQAERKDFLRALKDTFQDSLSKVVPDLAAMVVWSDTSDAETRPANFQFLTIKSSEYLETPNGAYFLRVVAQAQDLTHFGDDALHFRLALPPVDHPAPKWPKVDTLGTTVWPKGDDLLHRPVYTTRFYDPQTHKLTFDVFHHEGGRTCTWASRVKEGDVIGLTGPAGAGVPDAQNISIFADETAFPAVARLFSSLPHDVTGHAVLIAEQPKCYPLPSHPNITCEWITYGDAKDLFDRAKSRISELDHEGIETSQQFIWFAGETSQAKALRAQMKDQDINVKSHHIVGYWSKDTVS